MSNEMPAPRRAPKFGAQLSAAERNRKSRENRTASGASRVDFFLDPGSAQQVEVLMRHWDVTSKKEVVQRALNIVHEAVSNEATQSDNAVQRL